MRTNLLSIIFITICSITSLHGQIIKGAGITYFDSIPNVNAILSTSEIAYSIKLKKLYRWNRPTSTWQEITADTTQLNLVSRLAEKLNVSDTSAFARDFQISGTAGQVAYFNAANAVTSDTAFRWSAANKTLGINTSTTSGANIIIKNSQEPVRSTVVSTQSFAADTTNWTRGTGWTFNGTEAVATAATGALTYTPALTITSGNAYEVTYTLSGYSTGTLTVAVGNATYALPTYNLTGNVVVLLPTSATGGFRFTTSTFTGNLDNVSVVEVTNQAPVLLSGQDDASTTLYNSLRMPNSSTLAFNGGGGFSTGTSNNFFGNSAGRSNTTGVSNNFFGNTAGFSNTTGTFNNFFGQAAGVLNSSGQSNNFFGNSAGYSNTTGSSNNFFGSTAGYSNTIGVNNSFFGSESGYNNTSGGNNNFFGNTAGRSNTTGSNNNFFGFRAGVANTTGNNNIFVGNSVAANNTSGSGNIFLGVVSGVNNKVGSDNIFAGTGTGSSNTTGSSNVAIGPNAINNTIAADTLTGSNNIAIGNSAGDNIRAAAAGNVAIGNQVDLPTSNGSNQGVYQNVLFFTGASGTGTTIAAGSRAGIKTNSPQTDFHVAGEVRIDDLKPTSTPRNIVGSSSTGDLATLAWGNGLTVSTGDTILRVDTAVLLPKINVQGTANQIPYFSATNRIVSDTSLTWNSTNKTLGINTSTTSGANIIIKNSQEPSRATVVSTQSFAADTTNWTRGTGWTFDGTQAVATAATGALTYTPSFTITSGNAYEITYTISGYSAGTLTAAVGNATYALPTYNVTGNVVVLFPTSATGGFRFTTSTFTGILDNITIVQISNPAPVLFAGQDDNSTTLYNTLRMPNNTSLIFGGGGAHTTGTNNVFLGNLTGSNNTTGNNNIFIGQNAGLYNTVGTDNIFLGYQAGIGNTFGNRNNFFGNAAGYSNTLGRNNNFFGFYAGNKNTTGERNNFFGGYAGTNNTTGTDNNFLGNNAGLNNTTGSLNNFFGNASGYNNTTGNYNNFFGYYAGFENTTGSHNNFLGNESGRFNTTGRYNNFLGHHAGRGNTSGESNNFFGNGAGRSNTTGSNNTFIGSEAGYNNSTGNYNAFIGSLAGNVNSTGSNNTFIGNQAGSSNTTANHNVFFGSTSGTSTTTGGSNFFVGNQAGRYNITGGGNIFFGESSGMWNRSGGSNIFIGTNTGPQAVADTLTGSNNIAIGRSAGDNIAAAASGNIIIGNQVDLPTSNGSNQIVIGNLIFGTDASGTGTTIPTLGKVGIKTNAPASDFHVAGNARVDGTLTLQNTSTLQISDASDGNSRPTLFTNNGTTGSWWGGFSFRTGINGSIGDTVRLRIHGNGTVGVGNISDGGLQNGSSMRLIVTGKRNTGSELAYEDAAFLATPASGYSYANSRIFGLGIGSASGSSPTTSILSSTAANGVGVHLGMQLHPIGGGSGTSMILSARNNESSMVEVMRVLGRDSSVSIGTTQTSSSAIFEVASSAKGILIPRLSNTAKNNISSPATGLLIYNTTDSILNQYNGVNWQNVLTPKSNGNVGIGNTAPNYSLDVVTPLSQSNLLSVINPGTLGHLDRGAGIIVQRRNAQNVTGGITRISSFDVAGFYGQNFIQFVAGTGASTVEGSTLISGFYEVGISTENVKRLSVSATRTTITGEVRIDDLKPTGAPRNIVGSSSTGDLSTLAWGSGLTVSVGDTILRVDTTVIASKTWTGNNTVATVYIPINVFAPGDTVTNTTSSKQFFLVPQGLNGYCVDSYTVRAFGGTGTADIQLDRNGTGGNLQALSGTVLATKDTNISLSTGDYIRAQVLNLSGVLVGVGVTLEIKRTCN